MKIETLRGGFNLFSAVDSPLHIVGRGTPGDPGFPHVSFLPHRVKLVLGEVDTSGIHKRSHPVSFQTWIDIESEKGWHRVNPPMQKQLKEVHDDLIAALRDLENTTFYPADEIEPLERLIDAVCGLDIEARDTHSSKKTKRPFAPPKRKTPNEPQGQKPFAPPRDAPQLDL